ncbi:MAG: helix-turn-helix domain-containing protein [Bacilli bacterium]
MFDKILLDIRDKAELNQEDMAEILKVSQQNYSRRKNGKELIPLSNLNLLCNHFKVNMDYVIGISRNSKCNKKYKFSNAVIDKKFKKKGITQVELAEFLNTTQSTISACKSGKTTLLIAFVLQIVNKYKISLDWLYGRK